MLSSGSSTAVMPAATPTPCAPLVFKYSALRISLMRLVLASFSRPINFFLVKEREAGERARLLALRARLTPLTAAIEGTR